MELYCKTCNEKITTTPLFEVDESKLHYVDGEDLLPEGRFVSSYKIEINLEVKISILVNHKSVNLKLHEDSKRQLGCCGPSVFDNYNLGCPRCKTEIGLLIADCWLYHFVGLNTDVLSESPIW